MADIDIYRKALGLPLEEKKVQPLSPKPTLPPQPIPIVPQPVDPYREALGLPTSPMYERGKGPIPPVPEPGDPTISLMRLLASSDDPIAEISRINATQYIAHTFDLDPGVTYSNLESLSQYWLGKIVPPEVFAQSLRSAWDNGMQNYELSKLALQLRESGGRDEELLNQIAELEAGIKPLADIPRPWIQNALLWAMESSPLMAQSFLRGGVMGAATGAAAGLALAVSPPGLIAAGITEGMSVPAITLAMASVGFVVGSTQDLIQVMRGLAYWRMLKDGVPHDVAAPLSDIEGVVSGSIESLGNILIGVKIPGLTPALKSAGTLIANKIMASGVLAVVATRIASQAVGAGLAEGIEEPLQELTAIFTDQLARELSKNKELVAAFGKERVQPTAGIPAITFQEAIERTGQAFFTGMSAGLVFGVVGAPAGVRADVSQLSAVRELAATMPTRSVFVDTVMKRDLFPKVAGVTEERWREYLGEVWDTQQRRAAEAAPARPPLEIVRPEAAKGYRTKAGLIYTEVTTVRQIKEGTSEILRAGDPTTGERYGYITYEKVANNLYIDEVVNETEEDLRREMILDLASKNPGLEIEWNPTEDTDIELRENLISQNPRGAQFGLQWFGRFAAPETKPEVTLTRDLFIRRMGEIFNVQLEEAEYYGVLSDVFAENEGLSTNEWLAKYITPEVGLPAVETEKHLRAEKGVAGTAFRTVEGEYAHPAVVDVEYYKGRLKAVFAAMETADFHIGVHEFFHAVERLALSPEQIKLFEDALGNKLRGAWTEADIETLAERFEDYLGTGKAPTPALMKIFQEIAALLNKIISFIKERSWYGPIRLSPEFETAYDALFVKPESGVAQAEQFEYVRRVHPGLEGEVEAPGPLPDVSVSEAVKSDTVAPEVSPPEPTPTTTIFDLSSVPVVEAPIEKITLSQEVPNFKEGVSAKGVIEPLTGEGYQRLGTAPIVLWERTDGRLDVITGRHRLDLAQRTGEATIPAQIVREEEGFTAKQAMTFDAESNIRDGQGSVRDYANYFRNRDITEEQASGRGLLARDKGRRGYAIGKYASDGLYALYRNHKIAEGKAAAIAAVALDDEKLQDLGILKIKELNAEELTNYLTILKTTGPTTAAGQVDLFGKDESFMIEAATMAKEAAKKMSELRGEFNALRGALRLSKGEQGRILQKYGFTAGDVDAVQARVTELEVEIEDWTNWTTDPGKHEELRKRAGLIPGLLFHPAPPVKTERFGRWFGESTVVERDGSPRAMYHGTRAGGFTNFRRGDMGMHFGTLAQATQMAGGYTTLFLQKAKTEIRAPSVYPVYIRLQNPLRLTDLGMWQSGYVLPQLVERGVITEEERIDMKLRLHMPSHETPDSEIISLLKSKGYDGIVYLNRREGIINLWKDVEEDIDRMTDKEFLAHHPEAEDSIMVFDPNQIKSVYNRGPWELASVSILFHPETEPWILKSAQVIQEKMIGPMPASQIKSMLSNNGVKAEEMKWLGLDEFLEGQEKKTPAEVIEFIRNNTVRIEEVLKRRLSFDDVIAEAREVNDGEAVRLLERAKLIAEREGRGTRLDNNTGNLLNEARQPFNIPLPPGDDGRFLSFEALDRAKFLIGVSAETKYERWILPGGEDYQELLLTLPEAGTTAESRRLMELLVEANREIQEITELTMQERPYVGKERTAVFDAAVSRSRAIRKQLEDLTGHPYGIPEAYRSSHWGEINVVAHVRFNQRTDAEGNRVLFIEEIQSDWHQLGREKGYRMNLSEIAKKKLVAIMAETGGLWEVSTVDGIFITNVGWSSEIRTEEAAIAEARRRLLEDPERTGLGVSGQVPPAPFAKTWHELTFKRMLRWAVENGFDQIAWTTGKQQADRYNLAKHIGALEYDEDYNRLVAYHKSGKKVPDLIIEERGLSWVAVDETGLQWGEVGKGVVANREVATEYLNRYIRKREAEAKGDPVLNEEVAPDELSKWVGVEVARKLLSQEYETPYRHIRTLSGVDLEIGGEGMKVFYDNILVNYAKKYGKKWGSGVDDLTIPATHGPAPAYEKYKKAIVHGMPVTDAMKEGLKIGQMLFHPVDRWQEEFLYGTRIDREIYETYVQLAKGYESAEEFRATMVENYGQLLEGDIAGEEATRFYEEVWQEANREEVAAEPTVPIEEPEIKGQAEYDYGEKQKAAKDIPDDTTAKKVEGGKITEKELGKIAETTEEKSRSTEEQVSAAEDETAGALSELTPEDQRIIRLGDQLEAAINSIEAMPPEVAEKPTKARVNLQAKIDNLQTRFEEALKKNLVLAETLLKEMIWNKALITGEQVPGEAAVAAASENYKEAVRLARDLQKEIDERKAKKVAKTAKESHAESRARIYAKKRLQMAAFKKKLADAKATRRALKKYREAKLRLIRDILREPGRSISYKGYAEAIREIQRGLDPVNRQERTIYSREQSRKFFDENPEAAALVSREQMEKMYSVSLYHMTIEQLEEIDEMIDRLRKLGRLKRSLELLQERRMREAERAEAESTVLRGKLPERPIGGVKPTRRGLKMLIQTWKPGRVALLLDGIFEGGEPGVFTRWIQDEPNTAWNEYQKSVRSRMTPVLRRMEEFGLTMDPLDVRRTTKGFSYIGEHLDINGFRYTNGKMPTVNDAMFWRIGMQNDKTRVALLSGNMLPESVILQGIAMLTPNQIALSDEIAADFEKNFPRFRDAFIDIFNMDLPGESHYVPMVRLMVSYATRDEQVAMELTGRAGVRKQFIARNPTYARLEIPDEYQKPVRTDLIGLWLEGVRTQEGFIHQDRMIKRLHSILESDQVRYAVQQKYGPSLNKWISTYINDLAQADAYTSQSGLEKFSRLARSNAAVSWLAFNLLPNLKQLTGVTNSLADAGPFHLASAAAQFAAGKGKSLLKGKFLNNTLIDFVDERTELLRNRQISQEFEDLKRLNADLYQRFVKKIGGVGMKSLEIIDKITVYVGWKAVYDRTMAKTGIEAEAIKVADKATIRTQPSHRVQDMAQMYRSGEVLKWFTMFTSELSVTWNRLSFDVPMAIKRGELFHALGDMVSFAMIGLGIAVAAGALQGDPEDKQKKVMLGLFSQYFEAIPFIGNDFFAAIEGQYFGYGGVKIFPATQFLLKIPRQAAEGHFDKAAINLLRGATFAVGLPVSGPQKAIRAIKSGELRDLLGWPKEAK